MHVEQEEIRALKNGEPSEWAEKCAAALDETETRRILDILYAGKEDQELEKYLYDNIRKKVGREILEDSKKIENLSFCPYYKYWRENDPGKSYWQNKKLGETIKESWARLRCGSISKEGRKGFTDMLCRTCGEEEETLGHIWTCQGIRKFVNGEIIKSVDEWEGNIGGEELI